MSRSRSPQHGQILVIFAGGLLLLMAIAALVIDLGFVFMLRRHEQNAADPGAIAAARYIPTADTVQMRQVACFYARQNGFFPDPNTTCNTALDPQGTSLTVNFPPTSGDFSGQIDKVEVVIGRAHQSFFAGALGIPRFAVATSAIAAFSDGNSNGSSLIALDKTGACPTAKVHGTGDINIYPLVPGTDGGYVHVNSTCATGAPGAACDISGQGALMIDGGGKITAPHTYVAGTCKGQPGDLIGPLTEGAVQIGDPLAELANAPPQIAGRPAGQCGPTGIVTAPTGSDSRGCKFNGSGTVLLKPGVYYGGWEITGSVTLELEQGVYIFAGGGVKLTGGSITSVQGGAGAPAPVLFFNTDNPATGTGQANIDFTAQATLKLRAIDSGPYRGILLWNDGRGSNPTVGVSLGGQISLDIGGTIYNPLGEVKMEGGSGVGSTAAIQIIANTFVVGGGSSLSMPYDPNGLYQFDRKGLVR